MNDKIELFTNKIDGIILFYFLIQFMAADSILNDKGLNFIRGVMWMVTSVFDGPVGEVGHKFVFDEFPGKLQGFC